MKENKEAYDRIIDEAYENYCKSFESQSRLEQCSFDTDPHIREMFILKIKGLKGFSEQWRLKIDEREMSLDERNKWFQINLNGNNPLMKSDWKEYQLDQQNIPTKLITITYNNKSITTTE